MARLAQLSLVAALLGASAVPGPIAAQTTAPAASPAAGSPILNARPDDRPASTAPRRTRAISGEAAAALAAAAPKYTPPPPKPPPKPEEESVDMREVDKPKNSIVRLPKYIVQEKKPAVFRERDIHTAKGLTEIAMKRYLTETDRVLNRFRIPLLTMTNEARALAMYAEDERLRNMADLKDAADNASRTDTGAGDYLRRESQKTFLRTSDFGWSSGEPR
jgi:hypothetical protein